AGCGSGDGDADARALAASDNHKDRLKAIEKLRSDKSDEGLKTLRQLATDDNTAVAIKAMYVVSENPTPTTRQILTEQMKSQHGRIRGTAAYLLGRAEKLNAQELDQIKKQLKSDQDPQARAGAAKGLSNYIKNSSKSEIRSAMPALIKSLNDKDKTVQIWSLKAIHNSCSTKFEFDFDATPAEKAKQIKGIQDFMKRAGYH
ncbi:MAG: HEAT repeat domain-containing protein, partial [Phycisphaeraceae bacterium]|nr:HEAT repeat domain-containing protein [Phycisphaeraceae bacterium]